jgi:O-antigen ligase
MLVLPFIVPQTIIGRISSIGNLKDTSSAYRVAIWLGSINVIKKYWPSGIGLGSEVFSRIYPRNAISGAAYALHAHNLYLQIFVETGIVGILSFSILIFMFYRSTISAYLRTKDKFLSTLLASICAGMTGYLFQGLTDNIWYNYRMVLIFWMLLGFSAVAVRLVKSEAEAQADA